MYKNTMSLSNDIKLRALLVVFTLVNVITRVYSISITFCLIQLRVN